MNSATVLIYIDANYSILAEKDIINNFYKTEVKLKILVINAVL